MSRRGKPIVIEDGSTQAFRVDGRIEGTFNLAPPGPSASILEQYTSVHGAANSSRKLKLSLADAIGVLQRMSTAVTSRAVSAVPTPVLPVAAPTEPAAGDSKAAAEAAPSIIVSEAEVSLEQIMDALSERAGSKQNKPKSSAGAVVVDVKAPAVNGEENESAANGLAPHSEKAVLGSRFSLGHWEFALQALRRKPDESLEGVGDVALVHLQGAKKRLGRAEYRRELLTYLVYIPFFKLLPGATAWQIYASCHDNWIAPRLEGHPIWAYSLRSLGVGAADAVFCTLFASFASMLERARQRWANEKKDKAIIKCSDWDWKLFIAAFSVGSLWQAETDLANAIANYSDNNDFNKTPTYSGNELNWASNIFTIVHYFVFYAAAKLLGANWINHKAAFQVAAGAYAFYLAGFADQDFRMGTDRPLDIDPKNGLGSLLEFSLVAGSCTAAGGLIAGGLGLLGDRAIDKLEQTFECCAEPDGYQIQFG